MTRTDFTPRPTLGLIATGLVAASLTAAGLLATGILASGMARAAEPFDPACETDQNHSQPLPLIIKGFETGSAAVPDKVEAAIQAYAQEIKPFSKICVIGQSDKRGPTAFNDRLAMERARAVAARLIGAGLEPQQLVLSSRAEAFGDSAPKWLWFDGSRRVEVVALR